MKRCPECRRDYYDDSLLYCLEDGNALLEGPLSASGADEPETAILSEPGAIATGVQDGEATRLQFQTTGTEAEPQENSSDSTEKQGFSARRLDVEPDRGCGTDPLVSANALVAFAYWLTGADLWDPQVRFLSTIPSKPDPVEIAMIVGLALVMSFLATLYPALKAASTDPVQVLRYE